MSEPSLIELSRSWRDQLQAISDDALATAQGLLGEALEGDASPEIYEATGAALQALSLEVERVAAGRALLVRQYETRRADWRRARRFSPEGIEELRRELSRRAQRRPAKAAKRWLAEILTAVERGELDGAGRVAALELPFPAALTGAASDIRAAIADGDDAERLRLVVAVSTGAIDGWEELLDDELRSSAHRIAAWQHLLLHGDLASAGAHVKQAISLQPYDARAYVERSALNRLEGLGDAAARDAQKAIELAPSSALGYAALGACLEAAGEYDQADHVYDEALSRMPGWDEASLGAVALIDEPSGRLLLRAARRMLCVHRPRAALALLGSAAVAGMRGPGNYPEAEVHAVRAETLEQLEPVARAEVAEAALMAGRRYLWDSQTDAAIAQLRRAKEYSDGHDDAGWLLADALVSTQQPDAPDPQIAEQALAVWQEWRDRHGPPQGSSAWAYVTRAMIAEDLPRAPGHDADERWWEALGFVERALVEDETDALRWALRARYARNLSLLRIAAEALERARALDTADLADIAVEQVALLTMRDELAAAAEAADALAERFGEFDSLAGLRAYLAHRRGRDVEALERLDGLPATPAVLELRALCQLAVGDDVAAREAFRAVLAHVAGTPGQRRLAAFAAEAAGEAAPRGEAARDELGEPLEAEAGGSADRHLLEVEALSAFARGDAERASERLEQAIAAARTPCDLAELEHDFTVKLRLLTDVAAREAADHVARGVLGRALGPRREQLAAVTADEELAQAPTGSAIAADVVRAVQAHRLQERGALDEAAVIYEQLLGTPLRRMARNALVRVLMRRGDELLAAREAGALERVQSRLVELHAIRRVDGTLAVAPLLAPDQALSRLREALAVEAESAEDHERLLLALGDAAIVAGDYGAARQAFLDALDTATREGHAAREAQLHVRLGLLELLGGQLTAARRHASSALGGWREADAFAPQWLLIQELQQIARGLLPGNVRARVETLVDAGAEPLLEAGPEDGAREAPRLELT